MVGKILLYMVIAFAVTWEVIHYSFTVLMKTKVLGPVVQNYGFIVLIAAFILITVIYAVVFKLFKQSLLKTCGFGPINWLNIVFICIIGLFMAVFTISFIAVSSVGRTFPGLSKYVQELVIMPYSQWIIFVQMVVTVIFEEIIFRGVIFNELRNNMSMTFAVIIAAAIYGSVNVVLNADWAVGVYAIFAGITYTLVYVWTKSLWGSILVQIVSFEAIVVPLKSGLQTVVTRSSDLILALYTVVGVIGMAAGYYLLWKRTVARTLKAGPGIPVK
jgi:membrane protease YdiL (CAAX protease family)